jgi:hypothetical protein
MTTGLMTTVANAATHKNILYRPSKVPPDAKPLYFGNGLDRSRTSGNQCFLLADQLATAQRISTIVR